MNTQYTHNNVLALDPLTLPLIGSSLIEASAGTGKTYTISGLYLRLLLWHGGQTPLTCEQILVVTFTNAATEELRDRIRKRIQLAYKCFLGLTVNDPFIETLYAQTNASDRPIALKRLDLALKSLDEGAIFTIHGFCQRILYENAFETGKLFDTELIEDQSPLTRQIARDFWRNHLYFEFPEVIAFMSNRVAGPEARNVASTRPPRTRRASSGGNSAARRARTTKRDMANPPEDLSAGGL